MIDYRNSDWGKMWKDICPEAYELAIEIAEHPDLMVNIYEVKGFGWVIEPRNILPDFWLNLHFTRQQAIDECFKLGWYIR